jgi:hypothetical protein
MSDTRAVFDSIIQSATVDLFHSFGIAVAPLERGALPSRQVGVDALAALISFEGRGCVATLALMVPAATFALIKQDAVRPFAGRDWVRELTNQLLGRVKRRLLQFQISVKAGLPTILTHDMLERQRARAGEQTAYVFRTLRGEIIVTLTGKIDSNAFSYSGAVNPANEGDFILF